MKKYHLITFGCQQNVSDSERLAAYFEAQGYSPVFDDSEADLVVVNACAVRQTAVDRIYGRMKFWKSRKEQDPNFQVYVTGCVLPADRKKFMETGIVDKIFELNELPEVRLVGALVNFSVDEFFDVLPKYAPGKTAYIPIMTGCDHFCTYCAVPFTKGREKSRPMESITDEIKHAALKGYSEVMLLGQNVNSYGKDQGKLRFTELLQDVSKIDEISKINFLTSNPYDMPDDLIDEMANNFKISRELHLPVQAGDNEVLRKMNRKYTREQYLELVRKLKEKIFELVLTTDIIVGFCGETDEQFQNTVELVEEVGFAKA